MNDAIKRIFSFIKENLVLLAALSYFTGAVYIFSYYDNFGLSSTFFTMPIYDVFVFSFSIFYYKYYFFVFGFIIFIFLNYFLKNLRTLFLTLFGIDMDDIFNIKEFEKHINKYSFNMFIAIIFISSFLAAKALAYDKSSALRNGHGKAIQFKIKDECQDLKSFEEMDMFLIGETRDDYFVINQPVNDDTMCGTLPCGYTYGIPKEKVSWAKVSLDPIEKEEIDAKKGY